MPIASTDLVLYGSANRPGDDATTTGGAIDTAARPLDTQLTANSVIAAVSSGADTRTLTITGRNPAGAVVQETLTLNGTTEVVGTTTFERIQTLALSAASATLTVTVRQGSGGPTRHTFNPNETAAFIHFRNSASGASATTRYEKSFWRNNHATLTLNSAQVTLTADPDARIRMGLATAKNDTGSVANRLTAPAGITFVDDGVAQNVPGGTLEAGSAIGVWFEEALPANDPAHRTTFTTQLAGTTT
jgi:hypothetical protein